MDDFASIEPKAMISSHPPSLMCELSLAISAKRIADALEGNAIPAAPIYWSKDERERLIAAYVRPGAGNIAGRILAAATEAAAILRDRGKPA